MKYYYDLHIHSCLSPCSDEDMTPNNIVNMARLKGLDIIAVSDHNSLGNLRAVMDAGKRAGVMIVPAMELCTLEEVHLLCFFPTVDAGVYFEQKVYENTHVPDNRPEIFGTQWLMDANDRYIGEAKKLLLTPSKLDIESSLRLMESLGSVAVPAHVDREAYSIITTLGTIPKEYGFKVIELSKNAELDKVLKLHPELAEHIVISNSDAHHLWDISEQENSLCLSSLSVEALLDALRTGL